VLANEEVIDGKSERGSHPVVRMPLRQWMLRITAYADRLEKDLEPLDWPAPEANARGPMRVYAPGQDCIGAVVGSDEEGFSLVPGKQPAYVTPDPNDFAAPAATVPMSQRTYNCHYKGGFISGPKPTTTIAGDPAAPGAPAPAPGAGPEPTAAPTPPTKKP